MPPVHRSLHPAEAVQGSRGCRRDEYRARGAKTAALACLRCLDLRHFPITHPAVAREALSQNTQREPNTVAGGRKWQERKGFAGIAAREQGPWRTAAVSDSSNTSAALPWGQSDLAQLPKLSPEGPEPALPLVPGDCR